MARLALLASLAAAELTATSEDWQEFKRQFRKEYQDPEEELMRFKLFVESIERINRLNALNVEAVFGWTWTTDLKDEEKASKGYIRANVNGAGIKVAEAKTDLLPNSIDWRLAEAVTPVKNQGACGSCWAFSAVETIESHYILAHGDDYAVELSPQQLVSCAGTFGALNCFGGDPKQAYGYIQSVAGLANAWYWPYQQSMTDFFTGVPNCSASKEQGINATGWQQQGIYAQIDGYQWATPPCTAGACDDQDLEKLAASLALGPISVCVNAGAWYDYIGGVLTAAAGGNHSADAIDHCVQLVGFDREAEVPYWIVRNSWSTTWGERGYIRLAMNNNTCGIANEATIPLMARTPNATSHNRLSRAVGRANAISI
jgi:C1A family cysteine protease